MVSAESPACKGCRRRRERQQWHPAGRKAGAAAMLYGRYHGKILGLAIRSGADGAWRAELREILAEFDNDCRDLSRFSNYLLHRELATQIEHEVLRFSDPDKQAVLVIALKHFDSF